MKRFKASLMVFLSGLPFLTGKAAAAAPDRVEAEPTGPLDPVSLRPLNLPSDNLFAAHRSHSSHRSHRSSSGGYRPSPDQQQSAPTQDAPYPQQAVPPARQPVPVPSRPAPSAPSAPASGLAAPGTAQPTDPGRAAPVSPTPGSQRSPTLTISERRTLQIMRVQIALSSLGIYSGQIDGVLGNATKEALRRFQTVKGLEANGLMTTETLNALAVPAVQ